MNWLLLMLSWTIFAQEKTTEINKSDPIFDKFKECQVSCHPQCFSMINALGKEAGKFYKSCKDKPKPGSNVPGPTPGPGKKRRTGSLVFFSNKYCEGYAKQTISSTSDCNTISQFSVRSVNINNRCHTLHSNSSRAHCHHLSKVNFNYYTSNVVYYYYDSECSERLVSATDSWSSCDEFSKKINIKSIRIGESCFRSKSRTAYKACQAYKASSAGSSIRYGFYDKNCSEEIVGAFNRRTKCEELGLTRVGSILMQGKCQSISYQPLVEACDNFKN